MAEEAEEPCIRYKEEFDASEMQQAKLESTNVPVRSRKSPIFANKFKVEGLFHTIDRFEIAATALNFTNQEKYDQFLNVLDAGAGKKWSAVIRTITPHQRNQANRWPRALDEFVQKYTKSPHPRDVMLKYLKSKECVKMPSADIQDHSDRIEELISLTNRLRGTEPEVTPVKRKQLVFGSYPERFRFKWYENKGQEIPWADNAFTITTIVNQMSVYKKVFDREDKIHGKKRKADGDPERIRGGNDTKAKKDKREKSNKVKATEPCPHHHGHTWGECSLNPKSDNFRGGTPGPNGHQFNGGRSHFSGRGGGRNGNGRHGGRYGGRGGGRGYNSYNRYEGSGYETRNDYNGGRGGTFSGRFGGRSGGRGHGGGRDQHYFGRNDRYERQYDQYHYDQYSTHGSGRGLGSQRDHQRESREW